MPAGFKRSRREVGAAPCEGPDAEGACPLIFCNDVHHVLLRSSNAGA